MNYSKIKKPLILGILFFLPVIFLLFLYPSSHNYNPLDIVNENVLEIPTSSLNAKTNFKLEGHLTVLGFLGKMPMENATMALNLKELIYDKFKGFKKFQILMLALNGTESQVAELRKEIITYDEIKYWHFVYASEAEIKKLFNSLLAEQGLNKNLSSNNVFIIDTELNQRGRLDDRTEKEKEKDSPVYGLTDYNCIKIDNIKNKMSDDLRILFTEYRQKRKGKFNLSTSGN